MPFELLLRVAQVRQLVIEKIRVRLVDWSRLHAKLRQVGLIEEHRVQTLTQVGNLLRSPVPGERAGVRRILGDLLLGKLRHLSAPLFRQRRLQNRLATRGARSEAGAVYS